MDINTFKQYLERKFVDGNWRKFQDYPIITDEDLKLKNDENCPLCKKPLYDDYVIFKGKKTHPYCVRKKLKMY